MEVKQSGHGVYTLSYHVVWVTKYRRKILNPGMVEYLRRILPQLVRSMPGVELEQMGFDEDHAHFVIGIPPKYAIADVMGELKTRSASLLREKFDFLKKVDLMQKSDKKFEVPLPLFHLRLSHHQKVMETGDG